MSLLRSIEGGLRRGLIALRQARGARARRALGRLKARYHAFRLLLADNDAALEQLAEVERRLAERDGPALAEASQRLLDTAFDLVDGLNRITGDAEAGLYDVHEDIGRRLRKAVEAIDRNAGTAPLCLALDAITPETREFCGGKAASLGPLRRSGLPVPDGFVATTRACRRFFAANGLESEVRRSLGDIELGKSVEAATQEIRRRILAAPVPEDVASALVAGWERLGRAPVSVRSSALVEDRPEHSFAGQFHTELNVTSPEGLVDAFRTVLAGNFGPRPTAYRRQAGLPLADFNMAALVQLMVPARCAGVAFSVDPGAPNAGRMLVTAALGLGTAAVGGDAPVDVFRPRRDALAPEGSETDAVCPGPADDAEAAAGAEIADKTYRDVAAKGGGVLRAQTRADDRLAPALAPAELARLTRLARMIESLAGRPQDIEWAMTPEGGLRILQARPLRLSGGARATRDQARGDVLLEGGVAAAPGRAVGRAHPARSASEADPGETSEGLRILVLRRSMVEAAQFLPEYDGVIVELGNPADHLSCVARELGIPMLTGLPGAMERLAAGPWIALDADSGQVLTAPEAAWGERCGEVVRARRRRAAAEAGPLAPELDAVRALVLPLNLTDAHGPTFSIAECRSVHDIVRYAHERGVLAMFAAGDALMKEAAGLLRRLEDAPLPFWVVDLGGGLAPESAGRGLARADVRSAPLAALCAGLTAPGLDWEDAPQEGANLSGVMARTVREDHAAGSAGVSNYALVTRDYLNLNLRAATRFFMIDTVCFRVRRDNYLRLRLKDGAGEPQRRERRVRAVSMILKKRGFFTDRRGDLLTAVLSEPTRAECEDALALLGRLLGSGRRLRAAGDDDAMPGRVAEAFLAAGAPSAGRG